VRENDIRKAAHTSRGVVRDERGQDQPADKKAALKTGKPLNPKPPEPDSQKSGQREQEEAAKTTPVNPGEPAGGE